MLNFKVKSRGCCVQVGEYTFVHFRLDDLFFVLIDGEDGPHLLTTRLPENLEENAFNFSSILLAIAYALEEDEVHFKVLEDEATGKLYFVVEGIAFWEENLESLPDNVRALAKALMEAFERFESWGSKAPARLA